MNIDTVQDNGADLQDPEAEVRERPKGYFRVDHSIFHDERLRQLSGDCFRVFLWMSSRAWRFPASKGFLRASISMIHLNTGVSEASVSRALKELKKQELIFAVKVDRKLGNRWWVCTVFEFPQNDRSKLKMLQNEGSALSNVEKPPINKMERHIQDDRDLRSINRNIDYSEEVAIERCWEVFQEIYPDKQNQDEVLVNIANARFPGQFKPPGSIMRNLAVRFWFEDKIER